MKTNGVSSFVAITILAGLLTASLPVPSEAEVRMQAAHQNQLVDRNEAAIKAGARLAAPGQPAGPGNDSTMITLVSVGGGSERVFKTLQATDPHKISRLTVLAGMPSGLWCRLFPSWRGCFA